MNTTKIREKRERWLSQKKRVFQSLFEKPQTRLQVSVETGTPIQNVCRLVAQFRASQTVFVLGKDTCPISEMQAEKITTNPAFFERKQLSFFE
jgi:hypothetical protein